VEHYEMASYGTLRQWARVLGESSAADLLDKTLQEEGNADHLLSSIAERINPYARLRDHEPSASHRVSAI
jgi:ferritin-like metal-binding protein YciE